MRETEKKRIGEAPTCPDCHLPFEPGLGFLYSACDSRGIEAMKAEVGHKRTVGKWVWLVFISIGCAGLLVLTAAVALRFRVAPLPSSAYVRPDLPSAVPLRVLLPWSAVGEFSGYIDPEAKPVTDWVPSQTDLLALETDLPKINQFKRQGSRDKRTMAV
jgi:hypothetical protein